MFTRRILILVLVLAALPMAAQPFVVGVQKAGANALLAAYSPTTFVDLANPASTDGTVSSASVRWYQKSCSGAFKVKFFRPPSSGTLGTFTLVAERGPFPAQAGINQVALSPAVTLKKGDLLALTVLQSYDVCGCPIGLRDESEASMTLPGDVTTGSLNGVYERGRSIGARATATADVLEGVITAAGSLAGNNNSFFRTSLQIAGHPGQSYAVSGKLVFHRAGVPATPSDPSLPYSVTGSKAVSFDDVVQSMGQSGLGSIDVVSTSGAPPVVTARVFNDGGPAGTAGFTQDLITPQEALHVGNYVTFPAPADVTNYRVNVGIRTFSQPVSLSVQFGFRASGTIDVAANTFQQVSLASLIPSAQPPIANEMIAVFVSGGDVVVYASTTDNRTNDSAIRFLRRE